MSIEVHPRALARRRQVMSYGQWLEAIDAIIEREAGVSLDDLADLVFFRDTYDANRTPEHVAARLLEENGYTE